MRGRAAARLYLRSVSFVNECRLGLGSRDPGSSRPNPSPGSLVATRAYHLFQRRAETRDVFVSSFTVSVFTRPSSPVRYLLNLIRICIWIGSVDRILDRLVGMATETPIIHIDIWADIA